MNKENANTANDNLRKKAIDLLKNKNSNNELKHSEADNLKLIQELEIHQLEIELLNEELTHAKEQAELAYERFSELFDFSLLGYFTLSEEAEIIDMNHVGAKMLGKTRSKLLYSRFGFFVSEETKPIFNNFINEIFRNAKKATCDIKLLNVNLEATYVCLTGMVAEHNDRCIITALDITERKLAEEKLKVSEEKWASLFNILPVGVSVLDSEKNIIDTNKTLENILNITKEGLLNGDYKQRQYFKSDKTIMLPEEFPSARALSEGKDVKAVEIGVLKEDKSLVWTSVSASPMKFMEGVVTITNDITEHKLAEDKLKESEEKYRNLFNNIQVGLLRTRVEGLNILDFNDKFLEICEYTREELMNKSSLIFWADINERNEMIAILEKEGTVKNYECKILTKDGSIKNCIASIFYYRETGIIESSVVDISELKKAEAELHYVNELFNSFMENSPVYVFFKDENIKAVKLSKNFETMLGRPIEELLNKSMDDLFPSEFSKSMIADDKKILCQGEKIFVEEQLDGRYYTTIKFPIKLMGKPTYLAGYTIDVTESRLAEEKLRLSNNRLQQMFNSNVMGVAISNFDWELLEVNDYCLNIINYSREEFEAKGIKLKAITPDEWLYAKDNTVRELREKGYSQPYEKEFIRSNGTRVNVLISNALLAGDEEQIVSFVLDITERKRAEEEIRNIQLLLKVSLESQKDTILISIDKDYNYLYFNKAHSDSMKFAYNTEVEIGMNILDFVTNNEDKNVLKENYERALNGESHSNIRVYGNNNSACYESFFNPIKNDKNKIIGATVMARDITERMKAEEALKNSNQRYKELIELAVDGILVGTHEGYIIEANSTICTMTGRTKEELLGKHINEAIFTEDVLQEVPLQFEMLNKGEVVIRERYIIRPDGSKIIIEMRTKMMPNGTYQSIYRDITRRKAIEEKLKENQATLLEAQEMALIGNWVWDLKTDKVECSKIMLKILGVTEDEFDGTTNLFKDKFHPEDIEYLFKCIKEVYDGINPSSFDYRIIHKDGSVHAIHTIGKIEYDKKGKAVKYFGTIQDVTERKKIETQKETIKQLRLTAKYIDKAIEKERLAISRELHDDLGQSLTALKMELKNIEKEVSDKKYSALFNNAAFHIGDNIKIVQRLTSQLRPAMLEHLGLNTTIEWYVEEYAQRNKIKVISNLDDRIELPNNISLAIFRIVQESLTNISRHSQADKVSITMNISKNKDIVNLKITDNGIGIDKNKLKSSKSFGLIIMQERVLSLDGKIEIQNKNGTIITIQIPIKES